MNILTLLGLTVLCLVGSVSLTDEDQVDDEALLALLKHQHEQLVRLETHVDRLSDELVVHKERVVELQRKAGHLKGSSSSRTAHRLSSHPRGLIQLPQREAKDLRETRATCIMGNQYEYSEMLNMAANCTTRMATDLPYECLLECSKDKSCLGVDMAYGDGGDGDGDMDCYMCYDMSNMYMKSQTNHYHIIPIQACFTSYPVIQFEATICSDACYNTGDIIVWDQQRANTTLSLAPNGKFTCFVTGIFEFRINLAVDPQGAETATVDLVLEGDVVGSVTVDHSVASASNTFAFTCNALQQVWVQGGNTSNNCLHGSCTDWETNFVGELITLVEP